MRAGYGEKLRQFFVEKTQPIQLIDFGGHQVFESATVDTNILICKNKNSISEGLQACRIEKDFDGTQLKNYFLKNKMNLQNLSEQAWNIADKQSQDIKSKIEKVGKPLKDWDIQINYGIKTGFNEAFIIDQATKDWLVAQDSKSSEIIKPILRGRDIKKYKANFANLYLICTFPTLKIDIEKYPAIKEYLLSFGKERLEQSGKKESRKKTGNKWFETQDQINYYENFEKEKIVYPETTLQSSFYYDKSGIYLDKTVFFMYGKHLKYLLALFNSVFFEWSYKKLYSSISLGSNGFQFNKHAFEKFPIPELSISAQSPFIALVDQILSFKKLGKSTQTLESELDLLVFDLYGLNASEIDIVLS
jgi:hypothetical protein